MKQTWHILIVSIISLLLLSDSLLAAESSIFTRILHDFSPVAGRVTAVQGNEITVDCGKRDGVAAGDLFQVYRKGSPVSRGGSTVIGYLKQPFAIVQAQTVHRASSLCAPVSTMSSKIRSGMPVMRYSDMKAVLVVSPDMKISKGVRQRFEDTLPALEWVDAGSIPHPVSNAHEMESAGISLLFFISKGKLSVYGPGHVPIHEYSLSGESSLKSTESTKGYSLNLPSVSSAKDTVSISSGERWNVDFQDLPDLSSTSIVGRLFSKARQVEVADIDGDGSPETVYLVSRALYIFPFGSQGSLYSWAVDGPGDALGFFVSPGNGWIVVNVLVKGVGLRSVLLKYRGKSLVIVEDEINLWLSFADIEGNGRGKAMLGQSFSLHKVWGDEVFRLSASSDGIDYLERMNLPEDFRTGWAVWGDADGNGQEEICIVGRSGRAYLYEEGILRWSSPPGVVQADEEDRSLHYAVVDINGDGMREIVFAGAVPSKGAAEPFRKGWSTLYAIQWSTENGFVMKPVIAPFNAYIAGISPSGDSLLVAAVKKDEEDEDIPAETVLYRLKFPLIAK